MSPEDISENFGEIENCKLWQAPTENGQSRTHLGELQRSLKKHNILSNTNQPSMVI